MSTLGSGTARRSEQRFATNDKLLAADVMARDVVAVSPETPIEQATRLMLDLAVPGLPVVDGGDAVVGVLGEHDLMVRLGTRRRRPWCLFVDSERLAGEYRKASGNLVGDVMTHPAVTVSATAEVRTVVRLSEDRSVDLVMVLVGKRMVGAVSRPGLVGALAPTSAHTIERSDADILADMRARMTREVWISKPDPTVEACDGVVWLWGLVGRELEKAALITMARSIPGCRAVEDHLVAGTPTHRYHEMI
jgi:CBS domain-containing protein